MDQTSEQPQLSPEEYKKRREDMIKYFDEEIPYLTKSRDHQQLITEIEELHFRYIRAQLAIANMTAPDPKTDESKDSQEGIRKLRKEPV